MSSRFRSAHGSSSGRPLAIDSSLPTVTGGESVVGGRSCSAAGTWRAIGSLSSSFPESRSMRMAAARKDLDIEQIRERESGPGSCGVAHRKEPIPPACTRSRPSTTPYAMPQT